MLHLHVKGDLVWEQQTRKFNRIMYSFKPTVGLVDPYTMGEVTATDDRILAYLTAGLT